MYLFTLTLWPPPPTGYKATFTVSVVYVPKDCLNWIDALTVSVYLLADLFCTILFCIVTSTNHNKIFPCFVSDELKAFFGLMFFIEIFWSGRLEELWTCKNDTYLLNFPGVRAVFIRTRFYQTLRYLHFTPENLARADRDNRETFDKLYKVRPLLNHLRRRFQEAYVCEQDYSLDEGMVPYKGRLGFKQYHKDKPTKWGIKVWMLTEVSGYLYNFEVYLGKDPQRQPLPLSTRVVLSLVEPLVNSGAHIYMDRFYTSRALLYYLQQKSLYACGTVMVNRGFPRDIVPARPRDLQRGDAMWRQDHATGIVANTWMDRKPIHTFSTIHVPDGPFTVTRHDNRGAALILPAPPSIVCYNAKMHGVDLNDKMTSLQRSRETYHWYQRLFRKGLFWTAYNGYLLEGHFVDYNPPGTRKRDFREFILELIHELVGQFSTRQRAHQGPMRPIPRLIAEEFQHFPEEGVSKDHVCIVCNEKYKRFMRAHPQSAYADCPVRRTKTIWRCSKCGVYLCVHKGFTCFADYHRKYEYWR